MLQSFQKREKEGTLPQKPTIWRINQLLFFFMSFGVIMVLAKWASNLLIPLMISAMIALLLQPMMHWLERRGLPRALSLLLVITVMIALLILFGVFVAAEINAFVGHLSEIGTQLQGILERFDTFLARQGIPIEKHQLTGFIRPNGIVTFFKQMLLQMGNQFSNTLLILFTSSFLILDSVNFRSRMRFILRENPERERAVEEVFDKIYTYFIIMAKVSLITAAGALLLLWFFDVQYALLWAVLTFFLNFIPVIGSIIAAVPPVILGLVEHSWSTAMWVALGYLLLNSVVGNILQPAMMGRGLGLSSFTVFWSMVFWGWFFGPTGMILSVPLTMGVQFLLMQYDETRWLGFLLSDYKEKNVKTDDGEPR
ncbi:AI-2E family transporter [Nitratifractor sp.]|uniref:AI-2E family transporter n=1 Tax=Nitratifractor sp. TaxID=2268144 RepID=UPI0025D60B32|nr:AI-2E family transporter [Nitratifractor sp.]